MADFDWNQERTVLRGPFSFFNDTMIFESLDVDPSQATALLRVTYKGNDPLFKKGRDHPLVPPLHLHFKQTETFKVLQGQLALTIGYNEQEVLVHQGDEPFDILPWQPHTPYCYGGEEEDTVVLIRAHPAAEEDSLSARFFEHVFRHLDSAFRENRKPDMVQMMVMQHATDSALVIFPNATFLGSLRWKIPWMLQAAVANVAMGLFGYTPEIREYLEDGKKEG